ncbi:AAA family ATPase [Sphingobium baderi]|uniref:Uncharacterized protein n=1 Tax=Sphingobium baderi TaxID=1332080 RepID=A0A0S3EUD9_9SPHN|nr:AAA family ATPase [Sphingobium baderi]ALR19025.1 hypothetical protein ATN00_00535 [Sphingobium baderi]
MLRNLESLDSHASRWSGNWNNPAGGGASAADAHPLPSLDLAALANVKPQPKPFAIERIAPSAEVTLLTGPGSAGKSLLGQQLATAAAAGLPCLGLAVMSGPAIYLTCEDDAGQLHWRQAHICEAMNVPMGALAGKLHLISLRGELDNALTVEAVDGKTAPSPSYVRLVQWIRSSGCGLVILDHVAHLFTGNENDRGDVTRFVNLLNRLAGETGAAILLLGHPNKSGDSYSGSTAWLNAVRSQITIDHERDADGTIIDHDARVLSIGKANYAKKGEALRFRWHKWAFVREDDLPADTRAELAEVIQLNKEDDAFLACLRERDAQGDGRSVGPSPGPNYAPSQFVGMKQARGLKKEALKRAMDRLFSVGRIESATVHNKAKGRDVTIIREVPQTSPNASPNASRTLIPNDPEPAEMRPRTHTIYTTYITGAAHGSAAPYPDDEIDWGTDGEADE